MIKLNASELRDYQPTQKEFDSIERKPIYIVIDNVLDTYNVGSMFRLADAIGCSGIYLVGKTDTPDDPKVGHKIHKASIGTWKWLRWKHMDTVHEAIAEIQNSNIKTSNPKLQVASYKLQTIAIEQTPTSVPYDTFEYNYPLALIVGHETTGVSAEGLAISDAVVEIPMFGVNKSLNVMVSLAIVLWHLNSIHIKC